MTRDDWMISLENVAADVEKEFGHDVVASTLSIHYGATSIYDLHPNDYADAYGELHQMTIDN